MKILLADPAKNITAFVLDPVENAEERAALSRAILAEPRFHAEQAGFVIPPALRGASGPGPGLWRLEMMGGEFCGNAARSFGLYAAGETGLGGKAVIKVSVSGAAEPVTVEVNTEESRAAAEMPLPLAFRTLAYEGRSLSALVFEGITHIIAPDTEGANETFRGLKAAAEKQLPPSAALGVMFYDTGKSFMRPAVYVAATDTLVFESSCGSGSAALGAWLSRGTRDGEAYYTINQPGGVIETRVVKKAGKAVRISIGGEVTLGEPLEFPRPSAQRPAAGHI